jgi:hypothetical protein
MRSFVLVLAIIGPALVLNACGGGGGGGDAPAPAPPAPAPPSPPPGGATNQSPTISGIPPTSINQGEQYVFEPTASDPDGDALTFSITGQPAWATFSTSTGSLGGTPALADVGVFPSITISVSDGTATASLATFSVNVVAVVANGAATLSWDPPTENSDESPLQDLAGYRIYWGPSETYFPNSVTLDNPGLASYVVDQLTPTTWFFVVTAVNSQGFESPFSNVASKTIM